MDYFTFASQNARSEFRGATTMTNLTFQIVLVRAEQDTEAIPGEFTTSRGDGLNAVAKLRVAHRLTAAMWLRKATWKDLPKARAFATSEGYQVVMCPSAERDPLAYAKKHANV